MFVRGVQEVRRSPTALVDRKRGSRHRPLNADFKKFRKGTDNWDTSDKSHSEGDFGRFRAPTELGQLGRAAGVICRYRDACREPVAKCQHREHSKCGDASYLSGYEHSGG